MDEPRLDGPLLRLPGQWVSSRPWTEISGSRKTASAATAAKRGTYMPLLMAWLEAGRSLSLPIVAMEIESHRHQDGHDEQAHPADVAALLRAELGEFTLRRFTATPFGRIDVRALREAEEVVFEALLGSRHDGFDPDPGGDERADHSGTVPSAHDDQVLLVGSTSRSPRRAAMTARALPWSEVSTFTAVGPGAVHSPGPPSRPVPC